MTLQRQDIISDEAIQAPVLLTQNFQQLLVTINQLITTTKKGSQELEGFTSPSKIAAGVEQLTEQEKQLIAVQKQVSAALAKNNNEYADQKRGLDAVNNAVKDRIALGDRDAKQVDRQNASLKELEAALAANRRAYAGLRSEEARNSKTGKELLEVIQRQDAQFKELKASMGQHQAKVGDYEGAMKSLKMELKAARDEMAGIAATLGTESKEFLDASKRAGELKDQINDIGDALKNTEASPFENLGNSLGDVGSKLLKLDFQGAASSARQFAAASKSISLKDAVGGLKDLGSTLTSVGKGIFMNPLFLLAAVIGGIVFAVIKFRNEIKPVKFVFDLVGDSIDFVIGKLQEFTDWLGLTTFAQTKKAEETVNAANTEIEAINKRYDFEIKKAEAAGKETVQLERDKWKALLAEAKIGYASTLDEDNKLRDGQKENFLKFIDLMREAQQELTLIEIREHKKRQDELKKLDKDRLAFEAQITKERLDRLKVDDAEVAKLVDLAYSRYESKVQLLDAEVEAEKTAADEIVATLSDLYAKRKEFAQEEKALRMQIATELINGAFNLRQALFAQEQEGLSIRMAKLKEQQAVELEAAGKNEEAKDAIRKKFAAQEEQLRQQQLALKIKQAKFDKAQAIFNIGINTAAAIASKLPGLPFTAGIIALIKALAAVQIATVLAAPLPKFEKGTESSPAGLAIVGERGSELMVGPDGSMSLSPGTASLVNLERGTKIIPHDETMRMLAMNGGSLPSASRRENRDLKLLNKNIQAMHKTIKNKRELHINYSRAGAEAVIRNAENRTKMLNSFYA